MHIIIVSTGKRNIKELQVKCVGCEWEGTYNAVEEHMAVCEQTQPKYSAATAQTSQCYVYVDNSNVWITGQKVRAKKFQNAQTDSRFRVDFGRLLHLMAKGRHICHAYLYGSVPPPRDSVWKAAREKKFEVKTFMRSKSGKEKEVNVAMAQDMLKTLYEHPDTPKIFITVTGDRNFRLPTIAALDRGVPVELWSWKESMAKEFYQLAKTQSELFTVNILDEVQSLFSFTDYMSSKKRFDPSHAIVYREVPTDDFDTLTSHMDLLSRLFYITIHDQTENKADYIIEFPRSSPMVVLEELQALGNFKYQPCSYFECDTKSSCQWGDHCIKGSQCPDFHTAEEKELFARFPTIQFRYFRAQECKKKHLHVTAQQRKWCAFAHDSEDSWCLRCKRYGHLTDDCCK